VKRKEDDRMNRKLILLLIPMMILPMSSFGYAHFRDYVDKRYKIHVGSLLANITYFHVDYFLMPDVNNNGEILGDELNITIFEDPSTCKFIVEITANPITGGFELNTTMKIHNSGKLPWDLDWEILWDGPYDEDPCFDTAPTKNINTLPGITNVLDGPWSYDMKVYKENATYPYPPGYGPVAKTQEEYKPCNNATIVQHVNFRQPGTFVGEKWTQKDWQCKWIKIWVMFEMTDQVAQWEGSSWTWEDGTVTSPGTEGPKQ